MGKSIAQVVSEAKAATQTTPTASKPTKGKGKVGRPSTEDMIQKAIEAALAPIVAENAALKAEVQTLKTTQTTGKGRGYRGKVGYTPLDNPNFHSADSFTINPLGPDQYTGEPSFNFLGHETGESVIPDPGFRAVMMSHYGAKFRGSSKAWRMAAPNFNRFNADLASGAFSDFVRPNIEEMVKKAAPTTPNGKRIVAFYCE